MDAGCQRRRDRGRRGGRSITAALGVLVGSSTVLLGAAPIARAAAPAVVASDDAAAIDRTFALEWSAAPGCPDAATVRAEIRRILRDTPRERLTGRSVRASAEIRRGAAGHALVLRLEVDGAASQREMRAAACSVLGDATALLIAMTIDPLARPTTSTTIAATRREPDEVLEPVESDTEDAAAGASPRGVPEVEGRGGGRSDRAIDGRDRGGSAVERRVGGGNDRAVDRRTGSTSRSAVERSRSSGPAVERRGDPGVDGRDGGGASGPAIEGRDGGGPEIDGRDGGRSDRDAPRSSSAGPPRPPLRALLGLALLGGSAGLGSVGLGGGALIGVGRARWRIELTGAYWAPRVRPVPIDGQSDARVELRLGAAGARGCGVPSVGRIELPLCAGVELGGMRGEGLGVPGARRYVGPWAAITASPGVLVRLGDRLALALRVDAALAISRPAFTVQGYGVAFKADAGALAAWFGLELRWPR